MQCSFTENSQENKKALEAFSFKDERKTAPWYHLDSRTPSRRRPCRVPAHSCAVTGAPVAAYAPGQSAAQLQDHVRPAPPCPFSPLGALFDGSSGVLFSSSSLRLFNCLKCFVVYTLSPPLSTAKRTENPVRPPKNISEKHKAPEKPGEILRQKRELDCKTPVKLLSYSA